MEDPAESPTRSVSQETNSQPQNNQSLDQKEISEELININTRALAEEENRRFDVASPQKQELLQNVGQIIEKSREESQALSIKKPTFEEMMKNRQEEADYLALKETQQNEYFKATHNQSSMNTVSSFIKPVKINSPEKSFVEAKPVVL